MLEYKTQRAGGTLIAVPPQYTSQKCSHCGYTSPENRKNQAEFKCTHKDCTHEENADINASKNILAAGLAVHAKNMLACGGNVRPEKKRTIPKGHLSSTLAIPMKQEPTVSTQEWLSAI